MEGRPQVNDLVYNNTLIYVLIRLRQLERIKLIKEGYDNMHYKLKTLDYNEQYNMQQIFDTIYSNSKNGDNAKKIYYHVVSDNNLLLAKANVHRHEIGAKIRADVIDRSKNRLRNYIPSGVKSDIDLVCERAIHQVLEPYFEARFYNHSYGYRLNRGNQHALSRAVTLINRGKMYYVVDFNVSDIADNIDHDKLKRLLWFYGIRDKQMLSVIGKVLRGPDGKLTRGVKHTGCLSNLFVNIYLTEFDYWVSTQWEDFPIGGKNIHSFHNSTAKRRNLKSGYIVRYGDEFKIMCRSYDHATRFKHAADDYLGQRLCLDRSVVKSRIINLKERRMSFAGFTLKAVSKGQTKNGFVAETHVSDDNLKTLKLKLSKQIKLIQRYPSDRKHITHYNHVIDDAKRKYQYATHAYIDLDSISTPLFLKIKNRLSNKGVFEPYGRQHLTYRLANRGMNMTSKIMVLNNKPLNVINAMKHKNPMNFQQDLCAFTKAGRQKMRKLYK